MRVPAGAACDASVLPDDPERVNVGCVGDRPMGPSRAVDARVSSNRARPDVHACGSGSGADRDSIRANPAAGTGLLK